jgi:two-component system sensor histidine kinase RpfC
MRSERTGGLLLAILARARDRLADRPDSEHEQAIVRLALASLIVGYLAVSVLQHDDLSGVETAVGWLSVAFLSFSALVLVAIVAQPGRSTLRRLLGMGADLGTTSYCMLLTGEAGAPLFTVYLWVTLGNGLRYGARYLYLSAGLSVAGFLSVILLSPYWSRHPSLSFGLLLGLFLIPTYAASLLRKLEAARLRAEEASQAKSRFLANVSHEMRTPLTGVIGMMDLLLGTRLEHGQREMALTAQTSAQMLLALINEVLDISKIEAGKVELARVEFDLYLLVSEIARVFSAEAERKGLAFSSTVSPAAPFRVGGDPDRLREVLANLLGNAIKFTERGSVSLRVGLAGEDETAALLRFEVQDTGIGIPANALGRIFAPFEQADDAITRCYGGTGLGTTIAKQLVELMGGEIGVVSREGVGSRFWFQVPLEKRPEPTSAAEGLDDSAILVLGSEHRAPPGLRQHLDGWGLHPRWVTPAAGVVARLVSAARQGNPYRAVIVDQASLDLSPEQLAHLLQGEPTVSATHLILLARTPGPASGLDGYSAVLGTPLDKTLLFHALHDAFSLGIPANVPSVAQRRESGARGRPLHILLADDTPLNREVVGEYLKRAGHSVDAVEGGEHALEALTQATYDAVILDMHMPQVSGLDVLRALRFMETGGRRAPVVMLSADATPERQAEALRLGADAYLTKPVVSARLLATLDALTREGAREGGHRESRGTPASAAAPPGEEPEVPLLDLQTVQDLRGLRPDSDLFEGLVQEFQRGSQEILDALRRAHAEGDFHGFRELAHALQGSAGDMGAARAARLCRELRSVFPASFQTSAGSLLAALSETLRQTHAALSQSPSGPAAPAPLARPRARSGPGHAPASPSGAGPAPRA